MYSVGFFQELVQIYLSNPLIVVVDIILLFSIVFVASGVLIVKRRLKKLSDAVNRLERLDKDNS